jgi:hypothetical protein
MGCLVCNNYRNKIIRKMKLNNKGMFLDKEERDYSISILDKNTILVLVKA